MRIHAIAIALEGQSALHSAGNDDCSREPKVSISYALCLSLIISFAVCNRLASVVDAETISVISSHNKRLIWWKSFLMLFLQINIVLDGGRPLGPLLLDLAVLLLDISMGVRALEPSAVQGFHSPSRLHSNAAAA